MTALMGFSSPPLGLVIPEDSRFLMAFSRRFLRVDFPVRGGPVNRHLRDLCLIFFWWRYFSSNFSSWKSLPVLMQTKVPIVYTHFDTRILRSDYKLHHRQSSGKAFTTTLLPMIIAGYKVQSYSTLTSVTVCLLATQFQILVCTSAFQLQHTVVVTTAWNLALEGCSVVSNHFTRVACCVGGSKPPIYARVVARWKSAFAVKQSRLISWITAQFSCFIVLSKESFKEKYLPLSIPKVDCANTALCISLHSHIPRPSNHPVFDHSVSDQKLHGGKVWERGYPLAVFSTVGPLQYLASVSTGVSNWLTFCLLSLCFMKNCSTLSSCSLWLKNITVSC